VARGIITTMMRVIDWGRGRRTEIARWPVMAMAMTMMDVIEGAGGCC